MNKRKLSASLPSEDPTNLHSGERATNGCRTGRPAKPEKDKNMPVQATVPRSMRDWIRDRAAKDGKTISRVVFEALTLYRAANLSEPATRRPTRAGLPGIPVVFHAVGSPDARGVIHSRVGAVPAVGEYVLLVLGKRAFLVEYVFHLAIADYDPDGGPAANISLHVSDADLWDSLVSTYHSQGG
jgi:hypothetical protein